jgi:hypothetical protein
MKYILFAAVAGLGVALPAISQSSSNELNTCAAIQTQGERLACYDKLAGREATSSPTPATHPSASSAPTAAASSGTKKQTPAASAGPDPVPAPATASTPPPGTPEAFGLYKAEHPAAATSPVETVTGKVVDLKYDTYGRETISLEGGAVWQLAGSDAILAKGDEVTIKRASMGSYLMTTSAGRQHRVKRLR